MKLYPSESCHERRGCEQNKYQIAEIQSLKNKFGLCVYECNHALILSKFTQFCDWFLDESTIRITTLSCLNRCSSAGSVPAQFGTLPVPSNLPAPLLDLIRPKGYPLEKNLSSAFEIWLVCITSSHNYIAFFCCIISHRFPVECWLMSTFYEDEYMLRIQICNMFLFRYGKCPDCLMQMRCLV